MVHYKRVGPGNRGLVGNWKLNDLRRVATDGIIAHYKMNDDAADTEVFDSKLGNIATASANTDTLTGVGKINEALDFDSASEDYVDCGNNSITKPTSQISIAFWMEAESAEDYARMVATHAKDNDNGYGVKDNGAGKIIFLLDIDGGGGGASSVVSDSTYAIGSYQHVVCTYDGTTMKMYINGALQSDTETVSGSITYDSGELVLGNVATQDRGFNGLLDDVRIYDRALSLAEVGSIYNSDSGTETTNLFRSIVVAVDRSNFNDGTLSGATNLTGIRGLHPDAMGFDGVDDVVDVGNGLNIFSETGSATMWVKINGAGFENAQVTFSSARDYRTRFLYSYTAENFRAVKGDPAADLELKTGVSRDQWYHLVICWDRPSLKFWGYVDGVKSDEQDYVVGSENTNFNIGALASANDNSNSTIQNMRVYNRILTQGDVGRLYRLKL